jgi:hypothetical protein
MSHHYDDGRNPRSPEIIDAGIDDGRFAERKQRFKFTHSAGTAGGQKDRHNSGNFCLPIHADFYRSAQF